MERVSAIETIKQYKAPFPRERSILQSLLSSELRLGTVPAGTWYGWDRSSGQGLKYSTFIKKEKKGKECEEADF